MGSLKRLAAALLGALVLVAGNAAAEDCAGTVRIEALGVSARSVTTGAELQAALTDMDALVARCPEDAWLNALGAEIDLRVYTALLNANNNQMNQQTFDFLHRAFLRSSRYANAPAEERQEVAGIQTPHGRRGLSHEAARSVRREIMGVFLAMARLGQMHPYLKAEEPLTCNVWLMTDAQTIGYAIQSRADLVLMPFVDAAAEACGEDPQIWLRTPLAVAAQAHVRVVQKGVITDPAAVRAALIKARAYRDAYLAAVGFDAFYSKFEAGQLDGELRKHGVDPMAGRLARELWFEPENISSKTMQFSLAWALSEEWAAISEKIAAEGITLSSAGALYTRFVYGVLTEGREAGLEAEIRAALRSALRDVQESRVRASSMADYDLPPQWLHDTLMKTTEPPQMGGN